MVPLCLRARRAFALFLILRIAFFQEARKVIYQTDYPVLSFAWFSENMTDSLGVNGEEKKGAGHLELERALFLTKSAHWKYEAE